MNGRVATFAALLLAGCGAAAPVGMVDGELELPRALREVSGIVAVDDDTIACVQDEVGALFFVSLHGKAPLRRVEFGPRGDYEGLARVGSVFWVLRADGALLELGADGERLRIVRTIALPAGLHDWEGLCHEPSRGLLLVMSKERPDDDRDARPVFAVDPATGRVLAEPFCTWWRKGVIDQAEARGLPLPTRITDKGRERVALELRASELLALPGGDEFLLLSAADALLLRLDRAGRLLGVRSLDPARLPQPEGMTRLPDGRLLVASEADGGVARLRLVEPP